MKKISGFSLIELLASLSIIAILMAISLPALKNFMTQSQDEILQQQLLQAIQFAKREANAHHAPVALCQSNNQKTCSGNFAEGQLIFLDEYEDGVVHDENQILAIRQSSAKHGKIYWRAFPRYRQYLLFLPTGMMENDNASFWHCHDNDFMWAIMMSKTGRTRVVMPGQKNELQDGLMQC